MRPEGVEERLSALIRSGDRERIARELYPLARRQVASVLRTDDRDLIETATTETLLAVGRYYKTYQGRSRPTSWLYTIARREALRVMRTSFPFVGLDDAAAAGALVAHATLPAVAASRDGWAALRAAVPRAEWRRVWLLANEPGAPRSHAEIAEQTGYTEKSVPVILSRVRKLLAAAAAQRAPAARAA